MSIKTTEDLKNKSLNFNFNNQIEIANAALENFLKKFPEGQIKNIAIDDYVLGANDESFGWWIEFSDLPGGCGGGSANKHGIYKSSQGKKYYKVRVESCGMKN